MLTAQARYQGHVRTAALEPVAGQIAWVLISVESEVVRSGLATMLAALPEVGAVHECRDLAGTLEVLASGTVNVVVASPPLSAEDHGAIVEAAARGKARTLVLLRDYHMPD